MRARRAWSGTAVLLAMLAGPAPTVAETALQRGAYLVDALAACAGCHRPVNPNGGALSGGLRFGGAASPVYAANLTPDGETGIGTWSDRQIADAIRSGIRPDGSRIRPPMPQDAYRSMSDADVEAIVTYLRSVPAVHNAVPRPAASDASPATDRPSIAAVPPAHATDPAATDPAATDPAATGRYIAQSLAHCTECHDPDGRGAQRIFRGAHGPVAAPSIDAAALRSYTDPELLRIITAGIRPDGSLLDGPMPVRSYGRIRNEDLVALIRFLRQPKGGTGP